MIRDLKAKDRLAIVLVAGLLVASCASFQPIEPRHSNVQQQVQIGDTVRVITRDGRKRTMKVSNVTSEALYGEGPNTFDDGKIRFADIGSLEKKEEGKYARSSLLVYGAIGLGFLILHNAQSQNDLVFDNN